MKRLTKFVLGVAALLSTASCNDFKNDTISTIAFYDCYAVITSVDGEVSVSAPVNIGLELNWTKLTENTIFNGLKIDGYSYPQMTISDMKWGASSDNLWYETTTKNSTALLATGMPADITNYEFQWNDRLDIPGRVDGEYDPALFFSFNIDGKYKVVGSRIPFNMWGTTTSSSQGAEPFTSEINKISADPDFSNMTMTVLVNGAQFHSKMPALNIQLDNIPMKIENDGVTLSFEATDLIPSIAGTPYPNYPCTNIKGSLNPKTGMNFTFTCEVPKLGAYVVTTNPTVFGYR